MTEPIIINGTSYAFKPDGAGPRLLCADCVAWDNRELCDALPNCLIPVRGVFVLAETPRQHYNRVMQEDNH